MRRVCWRWQVCASRLSVRSKVSDPTTQQHFERSLARVVTWVQDHHYKAYEPADGNSSRVFPLTRGQVWPMRVLQQVVLRSPMNIRPLLGVAPHESAIGRGYMAWAYLTMYRSDPAPAVRNEIVSCLNWLIANRASGFDEFCWGDPYDYATRGGRRPLGAPILIWTALIGLVFLDAWELLGDRQYLRAAESVGRWIANLPIERTGSGSCLSYNAYSQSSIHNSNAMGAAFLARLGASTQNDAAVALAREAMTYTVERQRADGSWFYGEAPKYHWIDNFHTGYNLSALRTYRDALHDASLDPKLWNGFSYFKTHFFEADGRPKYFHDRTYPVDIQCAAQAIETLTTMSDRDPESFDLAVKVAGWTIERLQASDGHFSYRHLGWITVTTPMLHWGQGTMAKALALIVNKMRTIANPSQPRSNVSALASVRM